MIADPEIAIGLGIAIGVGIYFIIIPSFAAGDMQHSADSLKPFMFLGDKLLMLIRAYLAMGFFVFLVSWHVRIFKYLCSWQKNWSE